MDKTLYDFSYLENMITILNGTSFAILEAKRDKSNYIKYKEGITDNFPEEVLTSMKILDILNNLGYPMNELGTYLYKDVILEVYNSIQNISNRNDIEKCRKLLEELNDTFSNFYHYIAREWKELGVKPFHLYIQQSIERINNNNINKELSKKIYGDKEEEKNYGLNAFQIAAYVSNKYSFNNTKEYQKPIIKKLSNTPNNIKLKNNLSECI